MSMPVLADLLYVALFAVAAPVLDYLTFWPAQRRLSRVDPAFARRWLWASAIGNPWLLVATGAAVWMGRDRSWAWIGFSLPDGWRLWAAVLLVLLLVAWFGWAIASLARSAEARAGVRQQLGSLTAVVPQTRTELHWFAGVSLTAGFCEEFLFRGYFIWALAPWLGWWGAAALSLLIFAGAHAYQGWNGVIRVGMVGLCYTLVVAILGSLWPAIVLHFLWDFGMGLIAWVALREAQPAGGVLQVEASA